MQSRVPTVIRRLLGTVHNFLDEPFSTQMGMLYSRQKVDVWNMAVAGGVSGAAAGGLIGRYMRRTCCTCVFILLFFSVGVLLTFSYMHRC